MDRTADEIGRIAEELDGVTSAVVDLIEESRAAVVALHEAARANGRAGERLAVAASYAAEHRSVPGQPLGTTNARGFDELGPTIAREVTRQLRLVRLLLFALVVAHLILIASFLAGRSG